MQNLSEKGLLALENINIWDGEESNGNSGEMLTCFSELGNLASTVATTVDSHCCKTCQCFKAEKLSLYVVATLLSLTVFAFACPKQVVTAFVDAKVKKNSSAPSCAVLNPVKRWLH